MSDNDIDEIMKLLAPVASTAASIDSDLDTAADAALEWLRPLTAATPEVPATLSAPQLSELVGALEVGSWNARHFGRAIDLLEQLITVLTGLPASKAAIEFADLPAVVDHVLIALLDKAVTP